MKPLLYKTTKPFVIYVLIVFAISIPVYFFTISHLWMHELDEHNRILANKTQMEFANLNLSTDTLVSKFDFWNKLQHGTFIAPLNGISNFKDSVYTAESGDAYLPKNADDQFRVLITSININGTPYYFRSITSFGESKELVMAIGLITAFFFICILIGLILINRLLSKKIWAPFKETLNKLSQFNLKVQSHVDFETTNIYEFNELNNSLLHLINQNVTAFKSQKEFTENASHEIQTPLAILKNKLDLLLQDEALSEKQYILVEEMNNALLRSSRINKDLLLLAKLDNAQFAHQDMVNFNQILENCVEAWSVLLEQKNIRFQQEINGQVVKSGNKILVEILLNNLILNAIKYTAKEGQIVIALTENELTISNSGVRALPQELMFKRFVRFSSDTNGSGLGLSIIQEICNSHQWRMHYSFHNYFHQFEIVF